MKVNINSTLSYGSVGWIAKLAVSQSTMLIWQIITLQINFTCLSYGI